MELNREKLKRMFEDTKSNGGSANGGGGGGSLAGYATQAWVNEGFVSVDFFNRLFTVYGPGETSSDPDVVIEPNDLDSTIKNIKAMFGLWTEQYLSALGLNPGGTGSATSLGMLDDVDITTPTNGQALVYNSTSLKWENATISTVTALANLTDVLLTNPAANQFLMYDGTSAKWINSAIKTINGQSLYGSGDISVGGGASGNYLPLSGGTLTGTLTIGTGFANAYLILKRYSDGGIVFMHQSSNVWQVVDDNNYQLQFYSYRSNGYAFTLSFNGNMDSTKFLLGGDSGGTYFEGLSSAGLRLQFNNGTKYTQLNINKAVMQFVSGDNNESDLELYLSSTDKGQIAYTSSGMTFFVYYNGWKIPLFLQKTTEYVGIGTTSPSYKLHVSGSIYATGGITALSDIKQKNVEQYDAHLGFDDVANAPIIKFTWKDPKAEDKGLQVGSVAQYWEKVLPEAVKKDKEGTLSMSYGVVALVAAISTAKKVQEHERRIAELERENNELKERLKIA